MNHKIFRAYYVWPHFPTISMSGNACNLNCKHCNHTYLSDMQHITQPQQLYEQAIQFHQQEATGILLSGGCTKTGEMINLRKLLPTITKITNDTNLIIKLHTGLVDKPLAEAIVNAGIQVASLEIVGDQTTINDVFDYRASPQSYTNTLQYLTDAGMPHIVPHVCIGLHHGKLRGEFYALDIIKQTCTPSVLVFIIFRPTKNTPMENTLPPNIADVSKVITYAKNQFPQIDLSLGCIRPRNHDRQAYELAALKAGVTRMEIPSKNTIQQAQQQGFTIKTINACCALPKVFEPAEPPHLHTHSHS